jgi:hypothetical protein
MTKTQSTFPITNDPACENDADRLRYNEEQQQQDLRPSQSPGFKKMVCEMWRQYEAAKAR